MSTDQSTDTGTTAETSAGTTAGTSKVQLESEIRELRAELGETVEALSHRLDVKTRLQEKARQIPVVPVAIAAAAVIALVVWKKRS